MRRWVGFLKARGFYARAHVLACPELAGRAFAVVLGREVIDVSPQAEAEGARPGITPGELRWLCPEAAAVPYEEALYLSLYRRLWDAVYAWAPLVEPRGLCEGFFDATGCIEEYPVPEHRRLRPSQKAQGGRQRPEASRIGQQQSPDTGQPEHRQHQAASQPRGQKRPAASQPQDRQRPATSLSQGCQSAEVAESYLSHKAGGAGKSPAGRRTPEQWRAGLIEAVRKATGLEAEVGLAPNRPLAEMAARQGLCLRPEEAGAFLDAAPVEWLPQPREAIEALGRLGVRRVGDIAGLPATVLHSCLGEAARQVREIVRGRGETHVEALYPPPAVSRRTGPIACGDAAGTEAGRLRDFLQRLCGELWAELERQRMRPTLLRLTLDPLDDVPRGAEERLPTGIFGPKGLEQAVWALWQKLWRGEDLAGAEIELSELNPFAPQQYDLWGQEQRISSRRTRLERLKAYLTRRFGDQALLAACQLPDRQRLAEQILARQAQEWAGAA